MESPEVVMIQFLMEQVQKQTQTIQNLSESILKLQQNQSVSNLETYSPPEVYEDERDEKIEEEFIGFDTIDLGDLENMSASDLEDIDV